MFVCPPLPAPLASYVRDVLGGGGVVVFSGRPAAAFRRTMSDLDIPTGDGATDRRHGQVTYPCEDAAPAQVVLWEEFIDFPNDCTLPYHLRLQYSQARGWNAAALLTDGGRRRFAKPKL